MSHYTKFELASRVRDRFPGKSWFYLTRIATYDDLKDAFDEMRREQEEALRPKPYRLTIRCDVVIYDPVRRQKEDGKSWKYGDPYFPKRGNMARIAALYSRRGEIRYGWQQVLDSFPTRYANRDIPDDWNHLNADALPSTELYGTYKILEGSKNFTSESLEDALDHLINFEIFPFQSDLQAMVRSYEYTKTDIVQSVLPDQMLLGHSELQNEYGDSSEPLQCVPKAHMGHPQLGQLGKAWWKEIFGRYEGLYTVTELVEKLYSKRNISVILYDSIGNILYYKNTNPKHRALVLEVTSGHMYGDIPNGPIRTDIISRAQKSDDKIKLESKRTESKCKICEEVFQDKSLLTMHHLTTHDERKKISVPAEELKDHITRGIHGPNGLRGTIIKTPEIYQEIVGDILRVMKIKPYINRANGQINHIRITGWRVDIILEQNDIQSDSLATAFDLKYQGETRTVLLKRMWEQLITNYKSTFNKRTDNFFRQDKFPVDCRIRINDPRIAKPDWLQPGEVLLSVNHDVEQDESTYEHIYQHDTKNAYLAALIANDMPIYTALDNPENFTPESIDQITTGWYRVVGKHDEFLNETGWYVDTLVRTALLLKIINLSDITAHYRPTYVIRKELTREFLKKIIDTDEDALKDVNKLMGYFRLHTAKNETTNISNNEGEISYFNESGAYVSPIIDSNLNHTGYYFIVGKREYPKHQITSPIYFYIIQTLYSFLLDMKYQLQAQGCNVIGYCTDAVYFQLPEGKTIEQHITPVNRNRNLQRKDQIAVGDHYIGKFKPAFKSKLPNFSDIQQRSFPDTMDLEYKELNIRSFTQNISIDILIGYIKNNLDFLLSGISGAGKTTIIKLLKTYMQENDITHKVLAFSNCAVSLYDAASTFHREFGINIEEQSSERKLIKKISQYKYLIIDEYSMIPDNIWGYLSIIAQHTDCKFILAGDHRQLPPIFSESVYVKIKNKPNIFTNHTIRSLHNYNVIELNYSNRYADDNFLQYLLDEEIYSLEKFQDAGINIIESYEYSTRADKANLVQTDYSIVCYDKTRIAINTAKSGCDNISKAERGHKLVCCENNRALKLIKNKHYELISRGNYIDYCDNCESCCGDEDGEITEEELSRRCTECKLFEGFCIETDTNFHDPENLQILPIDALKYFDFGYAFTIWKVQGCTIKAPITIADYFALDMEAPVFHEKFIDRDMQRRILYTAMTRVSEPSSCYIII